MAVPPVVLALAEPPDTDERPSSASAQCPYDERGVMNFLKDKRRAGALALLGALVGTTALMFGVGDAGAAVGRCDDEPVPGDVWVNAGNQVVVGVDQNTTTPGEVTVWACEHVSPAPATWRDVKVTVGEQNPGAPGGTVDVSSCNGPSCATVLAPTGAEVNPTTSTNLPLLGAAGTGGSAGVGSGTCTYVNSSTPTCPFGFTVAGVTVNESDASVPTTHPNAGGCVTAPGNPCVTTAPDGFGVGVLKGNPSADTVTVEVPGRTESKDLGGCVGFNAGSGC